MSESHIIEFVCRLRIWMFAKCDLPVTNWATRKLRSGSSGLRNGSIGGLRTGSRESLEITNWCYARVMWIILSKGLQQILLTAFSDSLEITLDVLMNIMSLNATEYILFYFKKLQYHYAVTYWGFYVMQYMHWVFIKNMYQAISKFSKSKWGKWGRYLWRHFYAGGGGVTSLMDNPVHYNHLLVLLFLNVICQFPPQFPSFSFLPNFLNSATYSHKDFTGSRTG